MTDEQRPAAPPDLTSEHRAIGLHVKRFPRSKWLWHNADQTWLDAEEGVAPGAVES